MSQQPAAPMAAVLAAALSLAACGGGRAGPPGGAESLPAAASGPDAPMLVSDPGSLRFPAGVRHAFPLQGPRPEPMQVVRAFVHMTFQDPVFLTHAPDGTDRLFLVEQAGRVLVFPNDPSVSVPDVFLDIRSRVLSGGELGLLGLAFDPAFAENGLFFVDYTADSPRRSVVARYRVSAGDPDRADPGSEEVLLALSQPWENHNGGMIAFGPDRLLYISFGDGGSAGDPWGNAQDRGTLLGSILRIDPNASTGNLAYGIPGDNPFVGMPGVREEIWAWGLRNVWRFSFDLQSGELWAGDVGQSAREEIDRIRAGGNYGWDVFEGNLPYENPADMPASAFEGPVLDLERDRARAVIGGYVYRGSRLPGLRGAYVFGDHATGGVWALTPDGSDTRITTVPWLSSFGEDRQGELYMLSHGPLGTIQRLEPAAGSDAGFPALLSETGLFVDLADLIPGPGMVEYEVSAPAWNDGASARRWFGVAAGGIALSPSGSWSFPVGSVAVENLELSDAATGAPRRQEARVLLKEPGGWTGYTYIWREDGSDADLLGGGAMERVVVRDPSTSRRPGPRIWEFPSRTECMQCHGGEGGPLLGLRTAQMNRIVDRNGPVDQLKWLDSLGLFESLIGFDAATLPAVADPRDSTLSLDSRARSWLAVNCAHCHGPGGSAPWMDLRLSTPLADTGTVAVRPRGGDLGLADPFLIEPGVKESSLLWQRIRRLDRHRMPPIAHRRVDPMAVLLIGAWIDSL